MLKLISATMGLRVSPEEEMEGLDLSEHRAEAYPDFSLTHPGVPSSGLPPAGSPALMAFQAERNS